MACAKGTKKVTKNDEFRGGFKNAVGVQALASFFGYDATPVFAG
jgi:hypothetical protein